MLLPQSSKKLTDFALDKVIEPCRASAGLRATMARELKTWTYCGSADGSPAIYNKLRTHLSRTASFIYSPSDLRFHFDFTHNYPKEILSRAEAASRTMTHTFKQRDIDLELSQAVYLGLQYGSCIPKVMQSHGGPVCKLVMPWQFGVYKEDETDIGLQEAVTETTYLTPWQLWRRISHLPNAVDLFKRARQHAKRGHSGTEDVDSHFHQIIIAGTSPIIQTDPPFGGKGGGVQLGSSLPPGAVLSPEVADELICFHECWVIDDERQDYTTIQIAEPDILIAPLAKKKNFFVPDYLPYGKIQPNFMSGYFWGRTELSDLLHLQSLLKDRMYDISRLMSLQYDRLLAFIGQSGMNDELYDQFRSAGWVAMETGDVKDITPKMPDQAFADVETLLKFMDDVAGFQNILSGQGEPGVRAGNHAQTLLRTASPHLRDRALFVERQVADFADKVFQLKAAKDATVYWTDQGEEFMLSQLPEDYRISVDSHSSSPIYEEDHTQMVAGLLKMGAIDAESAIELLPTIPQRDLLKLKAREKAAAQAKLVQEHPELLMKGKKK